MALLPTGTEPREGRHQIEMRFLIAQDNKRPDDEQLLVQSEIRQLIAEAAFGINEEVADSREKSLALTHLEEALMWAGKAIFA